MMFYKKRYTVVVFCLLLQLTVPSAMGGEDTRSINAEDSTSPGSPSAVFSALNASWEEQIEAQLHRARIAVKLEQQNLAEKFFIEALNKQMPDAKRKAILLEMVDLYEHLGLYSKLCSIYEKYVDLYPKDEKVVDIYLKLGQIYRDIGAPEKAIERYYNVLNLSLGSNKEALSSVRIHTLDAQIQIAETYLSMQDYANAKLFFSRIKNLKLSPEQIEAMDFKIAYCAYYIRDYPTALAHLQEFIYKYPSSASLPEAYFMLSDTYTSIKQSEKAIEAVKTLLSLAQTAVNQPLLLFWQKKTANHLANEFYKQEDFMAALKIYQAMLSLNTTSDWQWPIIYQMGLCFEKLSMYPKAQEAYGSLLAKDALSANDVLTEYLKSIQEMAHWRKEHLAWMMDTEQHIQSLFKMPTVSPKES